jgi:uncharacterized protein YggE
MVQLRTPVTSNLIGAIRVKIYTACLGSFSRVATVRGKGINVKYRLFAIILCLLPASVLAQQQNAPLPAEPHVTVNGDGVVQAVPDRAWITISAESRASNPREAQKRNTEAMTPVLDKLKAAGVPADAIRTIGYDLQYEWDYVNNKRIGRGYVARNTIEVRVDTVDRVGEYLEIAIGSGATSLGGIRFDLKDRSRLEREALRLAVADARAKAEAAAAGAGRTIDRILRVEEAPMGVPIPMPRMVAREAFQAADAAAPPPISAGQTEIRAQVTLTAILK